MPDDINGNYSLPNGYLAVTGEKVLPSNHNPPLEDIAQALTARYSRDGRAPMLGNVPMNGFLAKGMGDGVDPGDAVNKSQLDSVNADLSAKYAVKTSNYTAVDADTNTSIRFTSAATLSFDVSANLRTNWRIEVWNDSTGLVTINPDSTDTINGATTLILQPRQKAEIFKTGSTAFQASIFGDQLSGPQLQGYLFGLTMTTNATDAANDIDFAAGAAASDTSPFYLMPSSAMTKRLDAAWSAGNNGGLLDTGAVTNGTYYAFEIQRSDTLATDYLGSLSSTAPTMPANYDRKRLLGYFVRAGGANGAPAFYSQRLSEVVGVAPTFACRAWVSFVGTGTVAIDGSGNVSSITDIGVGNYTVNFASAMPDANYSVAVTLDPDGDAVANFSIAAASRVFYVMKSLKTTAGFRILTGQNSPGGSGVIDMRNINVAVFR